MANRNKGRTRFKPGQSGNPNGRPPIPQEIKEARALNKSELERILNKYIHMSAIDISQALMDKSTTTLELMIGKIISKAIGDGDQKRLDFILDRLGIIVKKEIEATGEGFRVILEDYTVKK